MGTNEDVERVAGFMAGNGKIQSAQTLFRMQLVESWQIPPGAKILEIGCGQGDMTAVLADAVGPDGHVTAVDIAGPDHGAPLTLGQSTDHLKTTLLGPRIEFRFQCDVLDPSRDFPTDSFDYVVLAHSSWYFESLAQLGRLFQRVQPWARSLCYSEWDLEAQSMDQVGHLLAVLIQGQMEAFKVGSQRNVCTPFSRIRLLRLLQETGWNMSREAALDSSSLQDAGWEIDDCLQTCGGEADKLDIPSKFRDLLRSQLDILRLLAAKSDVRSLPSYSIVAERSPMTDSET